MAEKKRTYERNKQRVLIGLKKNMTQEIYVEDIVKVLRNKHKIEQELGVKITNRGKNVFIEGFPENEYVCLKILEAINSGFSANRALLLKDEEMILHILKIKDVTKRKDLHHIKARVIGTYGKTLSTLTDLADCAISVKDSQIGIIGEVECIDEAIIALKSLIHGSKWGNVYARLERKKKERRLKPKEIIKNEFKET